MSSNLTGYDEIFKDIIDKPLDILFAHEEKQIVKLFFEMLKDLEKNDKIELSSAQSGYEIFDELKNKNFDIVIIDEELPSFDIPKIFHVLKVEHPTTKILFLAKKFNSYLNNAGRIQYCRKPFRFNDLRQKIADIIVNDDLCAINILPVDIINTVSTIRNKTAIVIQNVANNGSGELFIDNKKIVQASVESAGSSYKDLDAIKEILSWSNFEGCISKGTPFPEEEHYSISIDTSHIYDKDFDNLEGSESNHFELSGEAKQKIQQYLSRAPYSITDTFVMNAFCTIDCVTHASIKDPEFNEMLYRNSDKIVDIFLTGTLKINSKNENHEILQLNDQLIMVLYKLEKDIWYYAILKDTNSIDKLHSIVYDFSFNAIQILSQAKKKTDLLEELA